jgi:peptidyl-prolyl cis-trans isomerase D
MFDFVRKHTKILMFLMFLLIIPAFVLVGVDGYKSFTGGGAAVAHVAGQKITQGEWDAAHKVEAERLRSSMPNLDPKLLDSPEARYATLEKLIREKVLAFAVEKSHFSTTDGRLAAELQSNPSIASLRQADGKLDMDRYRQLAATQGLTPEGFEARVRNDLSVRQVEAGVAGTGFAAQSIANVALNAFFEKREVQIANFLTADYLIKVAPVDADLIAYYEKNKTQFQAPEQATIEYVVLDIASVKKGLVISDAELRSYYEQNVLKLSGTEERRASHILINASKDSSSTDRQKAKSQAEALLTSLRKSPDSFAELAKKNSQDSSSAVKGGDLDYFPRGAMVKPVEDAVFSMNKGEISAVVESEFGFHIIKLTDVKKPAQRSFEELRAGLEADLKTQQSQKKYAEVAEAFTNGVYEQSDTLKPIAEKLKLEIKTANGLKRTGDASAGGMLANPKFLAAVFSPDSVEKKRNTEAVEVAPNQLVAARIVQYTPSRTIPFADVTNEVRVQVKALQAAELAKKEGAQKLTLWKSSPVSAVMPAAIVLSRDRAQNTPVQLLNAALHADASSVPVLVGVDMGSKGYAVVKVNKVLARTQAPATERFQQIAQYSQMWTSAENEAYYKLLKVRAKAEILVPAPQKTKL